MMSRDEMGLLVAFELREEVAEPDADVGVVFCETEFLADVVADDVVAFFLNVLSDFLAFEAEGVEAAVAYLPV